MHIVPFLFIIAGLICSFMALVYPGINRLPLWLVYTTYIVTALGGGAAINMILNGLPK